MATIFFSSLGEMGLSLRCCSSLEGLDIAAFVSALLAVERVGPMFQKPGGEFCRASVFAIWSVERDSCASQ
jgi:hypothetical protein